MGEKIITTQQEKFLDFFSKTPALAKEFYFTGGTALSKFYLQHRFSEDLDFFSEKEFDIKGITPFVYKAKKDLKFKEFDFQQSFNRNIFHLLFSKNEFLKLEFTYFPFKQIEKPKKIQGILVDSLIDIAVNKVFTIAQKPRGRDFFDLYMISSKKKLDVFDLLKKARIKFDWHIDWLQFGSQLLKVEELKDDPILKNKSFDYEEMNRYFLELSKKIKNKVLKE
ncbi:MAG: nucleotidyl transferase AbiEii/AbiGii toxin family protein [Candidatus Pacebacteria bacterium]|nr:nucleotidyl transferase AbiEii/AbiGii toxin family protein [Candidatus Paceibacterota bacterium]